jgi:hypothetical protein
MQRAQVAGERLRVERGGDTGLPEKASRRMDCQPGPPGGPADRTEAAYGRHKITVECIDDHFGKFGDARRPRPWAYAFARHTIAARTTARGAGSPGRRGDFWSWPG